MKFWRCETSHPWLQQFSSDHLNENDNFIDGTLVMHGYKTLYGDDLNENDNYNERKLHARL